MNSLKQPKSKQLPGLLNKFMHMRDQQLRGEGGVKVARAVGPRRTGDWICEVRISTPNLIIIYPRSIPNSCLRKQDIITYLFYWVRNSCNSASIVYIIINNRCAYWHVSGILEVGAEIITYYLQQEHKHAFRIPREVQL